MAEPMTTPVDPGENTPTSTSPSVTSDGKQITGEVAELAKEVGRLKMVEEQYKNYQERTAPIMETIWEDEDVRQNVLTAYKKRMGITDTPSAPAGNSTNVPSPAAPDPVAVDTRNALVTKTIRDWEAKVGIDQLPVEERKAINTTIGAILEDTYNKPATQVIQELPLTKLDRALEKAYYEATREKREEDLKQKAIEEYQRGQTGVIGSMPSGSVKEDEITLTQKERETARKMNLDETVYLKNKIELIKRNGSLI